MRIAVIGPTYPFRGGIAHHTTLLVKALREAGHSVTFISYRRQYPRLLYGRSDRDPSANPLIEEAERLIDGVNPLTWWRAADRVGQAAVDLVILPWWVTFWAPFVILFAGRLRRISPGLPICMLCHNVLPHESSRLKRWLSRLALQNGDSFLLHAEAEAEKLRALLPDPRSTVSPQPSYVDLFAAASTANTEPLFPASCEHKMLFCGIIRPYKGLDILIDALNWVQDKMERPFCLAIVGDFWSDVRETEAQIERLGLSDRVSIENRYVPNERLVAYIDQADVVILPYRAATQSAIAQAALARHKPIIGTTVGDMADLLANGDYGMLVPPADGPALGQAIVTFFNDKEFQDGLIKRVKAMPTNSWSRLVEVILQLNGFN